MESHYSAKFGVHKNCDSVDMLLAVEKEDSRRSRFNPPLLFFYRGHDLKAHRISY